MANPRSPLNRTPFLLHQHDSMSSFQSGRESSASTGAIAGVPDGGLTGPFYPASWMGRHKNTENALKDSGNVTVYVNGVLTSLDVHRKAAQQLADQLEKPVVGIYNASDGLGDFAQCVQDKIGVAGLGTKNAATRTLVGVVQRHGAGLHIVAHSQGSIIVSEALRLARDGDSAKKQPGVSLKTIDVTTFGNAAWTMPKGLGGQHHYVFDDDVVPMLAGSSSLMEKWFATTAGQMQLAASGMEMTDKNTYMLHQGGAGIRPHGVVPEGSSDSMPSYIGSLPEFQAKEARIKQRNTALGLLAAPVMAVENTLMPVRSAYNTTFAGCAARAVRLQTERKRIIICMIERCGRGQMLPCMAYLRAMTGRIVRCVRWVAAWRRRERQRRIWRRWEALTCPCRSAWWCRRGLPGRERWAVWARREFPKVITHWMAAYGQWEVMRRVAFRRCIMGGTR